MRHIASLLLAVVNQDRCPRPHSIREEVEHRGIKEWRGILCEWFEDSGFLGPGKFSPPFCEKMPVVWWLDTLNLARQSEFLVRDDLERGQGSWQLVVLENSQAFSEI